MYSVKIIGDHLERKDTTASKLSQSMCCNYKADFKLLLTKCLGKKKQHCGMEIPCHKQNAGENKELLLKKQIQTEKHFVSPNAGISVIDEKVLALLPEKHTNGLHTTRKLT